MHGKTEKYKKHPKSEETLDVFYIQTSQRLRLADLDPVHFDLDRQDIEG
jgi:hypothetical protein